MEGQSQVLRMTASSPMMSSSSSSSAVVDNSNSSTNNTTNSGSSAQEVRILCLDLSDFSRTKRFLISCTGVFVLYLLYGYLQELIFTVAGFRSFGWYLTLVQFAFYIIFGLLERQVEVQRLKKYALPLMSNNGGAGSALKRCIPMRIYVVLAALTLGTMGLSNSSLGYLNYPTQVIFKCCKLIPVMLGSILIQGKRYGPLDFAAALAMCAGLTWFTLADSQISPAFSAVGVLMISGALLCDAAIGNVQEKAMRDYRAPSSEVVLYSYGIGFVYLLIILLITGNLFDGIAFSLQNLYHTYVLGFLFSLSGYLGIHFVLALVRSSGAAVAATVTTGRKAISIIISFIFFSKPFTWQYLWSGLVVVLGIYLNVVSKQHKVSFNDLRLSLWKFYLFKHYKLNNKNKLLVNV